MASKKKYKNAFKNNGHSPKSKISIYDAFDFHQKGQLDQAESMYKRIIENQPLNSEAYNLLGVIAIQTGDFKKAVSIVDEAIKINSNIDTYHFNKANALQNLNRNNEAIESFDYALKLNPEYADAHSNRGLALENLGRDQEALFCYHEAIKIKSDQAEFYYNRGNIYQKLNLYSEALKDYQAAISINPNYGNAYYNFGNTLRELGNFNLAIAAYDKAIELLSNKSEIYNVRGFCLYELKEFELAIASYDIASSLNAGNFQVFYNKANALIELKRYEEALINYDVAIGLNSNYIEAYCNKGLTCSKLSQHELAIKNYEEAIKLDSENAEIYFNLGNEITKLGQFEKAIEIYEKAILIKADYANAFVNKGIALKELKKFNEALECYEKAINLNPDLVEAYCNLGVVQYNLKKLNDSVESYKKAIVLKPDFWEVYANLSASLCELSFYESAIENCNKAISLNPNSADSYANRGLAFNMLNKLEAAVESYDNAYQLNPNMPYLLGYREQVRRSICDWSSFSETIAICKSGIESIENLVSSFIILNLLDSPELHLSIAKKYSGKFLIDHDNSKLIKRDFNGRLRIGFYSSDLYYHPVTIWLAEQVENHDKTRVELFAFSLKPVFDPMRSRLLASFDHFFDVESMSDPEIVTLSRQLGIDIAVDLNGHTGVTSRTGIFANRVAPIQVSHLGFPGSMGANYIDYFISDPVSVSDSARSHFTEKIAYVPSAYTYDRKRKLSEEPLTRAQYGLPEAGFVFTCQNGCQKFTPEVFDIWMAILKAVPGSVLWLLKPNGTAEKNLIKEAQSRGIESDRLIFSEREVVPIDQEPERIAKYLTSYKLADLFLDTWPYNAGTTAVDALWAGLPVLTKIGNSTVARMAASALSAIEINELVTISSEEYMNLAIELATKPERLALIKQKLQMNRLTTKLFDPVGNTRYIENAYIEMHRRFLNNLPPDHLFIE